MYGFSIILQDFCYVRMSYLIKSQKNIKLSFRIMLQCEICTALI